MGGKGTDGCLCRDRLNRLEGAICSRNTSMKSLGWVAWFCAVNSAYFYVIPVMTGPFIP